MSKPEREIDLGSVVRDATEEITLKKVDDDCDNAIKHSNNFLPSEVLCDIFARLSLKVRKNVRLVCKYWNECASVKLIAKCEKFVFRTHHNEQEVIRILQSSFVRPNLEFQNYTIDASNLSTDFWETCGPKIESLDLYNCKWNVDVVKGIIIYCTKLRSLTIQSYYKPSPEILACLHQLLNNLIEDGVERVELNALTILLRGYQDDPDFGELLNRFLLICPTIQHFRTGPFRESTESLGHALRGTIQPLPSVLLAIHKFQCLTSLAFNYCTTGDWIEDFSKLKHKFRLTEFETTLTYCPFMEEKLLNFFKQQYNLRAVTFFSVSSILYSPDEQNFHKKLILHCLENCPNLRNFSFLKYCYGRFRRYFKLRFTDEEVARLTTLIKNLKFLNLYFEEPILLEPTIHTGAITLPFRSPISNYALTTLSLSNNSISRDILKHCPSLKHLKFLSPCYETFQIIFEYLPNLQTLVLYCVNNLFLRKGLITWPTISRLQKLKYLDLYGYQCMLGCEHRLENLCELQSPSLECLSVRICCFDVLSGEAGTQLLSNIPAVTSLTLPLSCGDRDENAYFSYREKVVEFCKHLKNLYHLKIENFAVRSTYTSNEFFNAELVMKLFEVCPSLRYVSNIHAPSIHVSNIRKPFTTFHFDSTTSKVIQLDKDSLKFEPENSSINSMFHYSYQ